MPAIEFRSLTKKYGDRVVVDNLSFGVEPGRITGFLGPNGAGKTTTFRILLGLATPTSGDALINGRRYHDLDNPRRTVGALLEASGFHPGRTARNHLGVIAKTCGADAARIEHVLRQVDLLDAADRRVGGFSLGMRQRLGLASAALGEPDVLVLDEPANGLDPAGIAWLRTTLRHLADEGRSIVVSSHLLSEVAQTVDDVIVIAEGKLRYSGSLADLEHQDGSLEDAFLHLTTNAAPVLPTDAGTMPAVVDEPPSGVRPRITDHFQHSNR